MPRGGVDMGRLFLLLLLFLFSFLCGCFYLAPLDEDVIEEDLPPSINMFQDVQPAPGNISVNLSDGGIRSFVVTRVSDPNESQVLFWRAIINYGEMVIATSPARVLPDQRVEGGIRFQYSPCTDPDRNWALEGGSYSLYIVVSDAPFKETGQFFRNDMLRLPFEIEGGRSAAPVHWLVKLQGACPFFH